jgi:predicted phosphate transport protein (TIGR00153 family)
MWFHKPVNFFELLLKQAEMSQKGLKCLCEFMEDPSEQHATAVKEVEQAADELRRELIESLNRAFVTRIDREDIFALSRAIDDVVDYADTTVQEMHLFKVQPNVHLKKMAQALHQTTQHITSAMKMLPLMRQDRDMLENLIRAKKSENLMEHLYREALAELFQSSDVVSILKLREIYRHLNNAADCGDEAADIIGNILVKNT